MHNARVGSPLSRFARGALAGATGAALWAWQQPLDKRVFACAYDDVELLGKLIAAEGGWARAGWALHLANGSGFGVAYVALEARLPGPAWFRGLLAAQIENFGGWPLVRLVDRFHPARAELVPLTGNRRALAQATWRHAIFGVVVGALVGTSGHWRPQLPPRSAIDSRATMSREELPSSIR